MPTMPRASLFATLSTVVIALAAVVAVYAPYVAQAVSRAPCGDTIYLTGPLFCEISRSLKAGAEPLTLLFSLGFVGLPPLRSSAFPSLEPAILILRRGRAPLNASKSPRAHRHPTGDLARISLALPKTI